MNRVPGVQVGRPKLALDQLWPPLGLLAAAKPELCSPHWRTELAFQEEGGLAPMFRAVLEGHTHNLATLCAYIDQDHGDPYVVLDFPRIKAGRCGLVTTRTTHLCGRAGAALPAQVDRAPGLLLAACAQHMQTPSGAPIQARRLQRGGCLVLIPPARGCAGTRATAPCCLQLPGAC